MGSWWSRLERHSQELRGCRGKEVAAFCGEEGARVLRCGVSCALQTNHCGPLICWLLNTSDTRFTEGRGLPRMFRSHDESETPSSELYSNFPKRNAGPHTATD